MMLFESEKEFERFYIFHTKNTISKQEFLKIMAVDSNKFAGVLLGRIYDCFFSEVINLCEEYQVYHTREYETFQMFLERKYNLPRDVTKKGSLLVKAHKGTTLFFRKEHVMGDYNLEQFIFRQEGFLSQMENVFKGD